MKIPKAHANLVCGTDNIIINGWTQADHILTTDECATHVSYLLQMFSKVISENHNITPRQASNLLIATAQRQFNETYPNVLGNPDSKPKKTNSAQKDKSKNFDAMLKRVPGHYGANQ